MILRHKITKVEIEVMKWQRRLQTVRRNVFAWSKALDTYLLACGRTHRLVMVTLSYHYGEDWEPKAISEYMAKVRRASKGGILAYLWVAETQERGAIHYHVLLLVKRGTGLDKPDQAGLWNHGSTRIETARTPYYVCKYVGKEYQKKGALPVGARVCASYVQKGLISDVAMAEYKAECAPKWVREMRGFLVGTGFMEETDKVVKKGAAWKLGEITSESEYELVTNHEEGERRKAHLSENKFGDVIEIKPGDFYRGYVPKTLKIPVPVRAAIETWVHGYS